MLTLTCSVASSLSLAIRDYTHQSQEDQNAKNTQRDLPLVSQERDNLVKVPLLSVVIPTSSHAPMTLTRHSGLIPHMGLRHRWPAYTLRWGRSGHQTPSLSFKTSRNT